MPQPIRTPLSVDTLWQIERLGAPALSPDGSQAVVSCSRYDVASDKTLSQLWLLSTGGCAPRRLTTCGDKDRQAAWSPQGDCIAFLAPPTRAGRAESAPQLHVIAADGGEAVCVSDIAVGVEAFKWMPDGKHIVGMAWVWPGVKGMAAQNQRARDDLARKESGYVTSESFYRYWDRNLPMGRVVHLLYVNVATGHTIDLLDGTAYELPREDLHAGMFDIHPEGKRIVFMHDPASEKRGGNPHALYELNLTSRRVRPLVNDANWDFAHPRYSPDGAQLATIATAQTPKHTHFGQLAIISQRGRWQALDATWDRDVSGPLRWSATGDAVFFLAEVAGRCHVWRRRLSGAVPELVWQGGWTQGFDLAGESGREVLVTATDRIDSPVQIHAADMAGSDGKQILARRIEQFNDALFARLQLGPVEVVDIQGALGDTVQMWLVFPPNFQRSDKHPVLHVIHGGPYTAAGDTFGYRWNPHLLASRGHVVALVNYHGSSGFGHAFRDSIMGRMGQLEFIDIEAGTDWLQAQPWTDSSRIYASGGSYGGFLVAWMNGHASPERYRAYICHAGVFDRAATWSADSYTQRFRDLHATYWADPAKVAAQSPISFAAKMHTPTLISHGALDYRVPDHNGLAYYNTLKARGISARLLWFPDENHWILKAPNARQWYGEVFDWLAANEPVTTRNKTRRSGR
jgi:dipeptidyl aminopeptidase/acylaminoacyl peptidase